MERDGCLPEPRVEERTDIPGGCKEERGSVWGRQEVVVHLQGRMCVRRDWSLSRGTRVV